MKNIKNVAIILAAGSGSRFGDANKIPKQYLAIDNSGDSILRIVLKKFSNHPEIDKIIVAIREEDIDLYKKAALGIKKLLPHVIGANSRQNSARFALEALTRYMPKNVLIHDAVRPYVSDDLISRVLKELEKNYAVDSKLEIYDSIKLILHSTRIGILDRSECYISQTPQGFLYQDALELHKKYRHEAFTDDVSLFIRDGRKINVVEGDYKNIKITRSEDLKEVIDQTDSTSCARIGIGYDIHRYEKCDNTFIKLAGVLIPSDYKIIAHSDGDLVMHALTDALLGAMSAGSIGEIFPDTSSKYKDHDSKNFLLYAKKLLIKKGYKINNLDIVIIAQEPKIMRYAQLMQSTIAEILSIEEDQVGIKATTSEKLGPIGNKEGISCNASCIISKLL